MRGLYIHVPMCTQKCGYCDFYSVSGVNGERLTEALRGEIAVRKDFFCGGAPDTIYIGGGTPSLLSPAQLQGLLDSSFTETRRPPKGREAAETGRRVANSQFSTLNSQLQRETTLEANPEDLTEEYVEALAASGFNRLSIGIQSFDDDVLRLMNRRHTAQRARQAVEGAKRAGFENISIDLIYGIPEMTSAAWEDTLHRAVELGVQHISAYHLTIEPSTAFGRAGMRPVAEAESERQYETLRRVLSEAGFEQYEVSNFALPNHRAVHNGNYWRGGAYLGIGPGAHSFDGVRTRSWVASDVAAYLAGNALRHSEVLSDGELRNERLMVGLRTVEGVERTEELATRAERFLRDGLLVERGGRLAIPPEKFLVSDYVIASLFE